MFTTQSRSNMYEWRTSVAADFAIWRCASSLAFPGGDVTLEFTFISMPTSLAVTVSTVTLPMAFTQKEFYTVRKKATVQSSINFLSLQNHFLPLKISRAPRSLLKIINLCIFLSQLSLYMYNYTNKSSQCIFALAYKESDLRKKAFVKKWQERLLKSLTLPFEVYALLECMLASLYVCFLKQSLKLFIWNQPLRK